MEQKYYKTTITMEYIDDIPWKDEDHEDFEHWMRNCPEIMKVTKTTEETSLTK
jgi:hypothetical protein